MASNYLPHKMLSSKRMLLVTQLSFLSLAVACIQLPDPPSTINSASMKQPFIADHHKRIVDHQTADKFQRAHFDRLARMLSQRLRTFTEPSADRHESHFHDSNLLAVREETADGDAAPAEGSTDDATTESASSSSADDGATGSDESSDSEAKSDTEGSEDTGGTDGGTSTTSSESEGNSNSSTSNDTGGDEDSTTGSESSSGTEAEKPEGSKDGEGSTTGGDSSQGGEADQKPTSESTGESKDKNETAFASFTLKHVTEGNSADEPFTVTPLFENGTLVGQFEHCPKSSAVSSLSKEDEENCYVDGPYMDRIAFQFSFLPNTPGYQIAEPQVQTTADSGIAPSIHEFHSDRTTGSGAFSILYGCKRDAQEKSYLSLRMQVTKDRSVEVIWTKACGRGRFEHMHFGFTAHDQSIILFNADGTYGTDEKRTLDVGPLDTTTELVMQLTPPAQQLDFLDPQVSSDSEDVIVTLRGAISGGTANSDKATKFSVLYDCPKSVPSAQIRFTVAIPPWDNVTATWRKDCGGAHSQALVIGTGNSGPSSYDVMQGGELRPEFNVGAGAHIDDVDEHTYVVPGDSNQKRFYFMNSDDTSDIQIQTISTTMSDPDVVAAYVATGTFGNFISADGATIERQKTKSLLLHFMCKTDGKSLVLVTLPTLRYKTIEFGFIKECFAPKLYRGSGFLTTAGSLLWVFLTVACCAGVGLWIYLRRRGNSIKYAPVPSQESAGP